MSKKSLVSVIIIFFNAEEFIQEAISSVLDQTYQHWELLLVDDGSTDGSTSIARRYAVKNPQQVHYLEHLGHQNRGMSASRNLGIRHAKGDYVAFLDADDIWLPRRLERQVAILDSQPEAAMLYGSTQYWYSWTGNPEDKTRDYEPELGVSPNTLVDPPLLLPHYLKGTAAVPCTCSILVRRDSLNQVGGFEESFLGLYEDQAFYAKICLTEPVFILGECLDRYRQHSTASTALAQKTGQEYLARQHFLKWLADYLVENGITDSEVWQALKRELWLKRSPTWLRSSRRARYLVRWTKKWLLRLEERIVPAPIRRWLWSQWLYLENIPMKKV